MKEFFMNYYKEIIVLFCFLLELVVSSVAIIKKSKKGSTLYADILSALPVIISEVENKIGSGHGYEKRNLVMSIVEKMILKETGHEITRSENLMFRDAIERILSTPQKKG